MKNLKRSIQVLSLFAVGCLFAQTASEVEFATSSDTTLVADVSFEYLMAHRVHLRENPSLKAKKLAVLDIGTKLVLQEKSRNYEELDGIKSHWYKVKFRNEEGWIWGGMIAQKTFGSQANYDVKFVYGLESVGMNGDGVLVKKHQLRAFKNGRQIDKIVFDGYGSFPMNVQNMGNKGLFNVEDILRFTISSDSKESPVGQLYIFWNNGKFTKVASLIDYADANYAKSESFVFPSDMEGIKSTIVLETIITDYGVEDSLKLAQENTKMVVSFYTWDGYKLSQRESLPPISTDIVSTTSK